MLASYRGFHIRVEKPKTGAAEPVIVYLITRQSDGLEVMKGKSFESYTVREFAKHLRGVVDDFIEDPQPYMKNTTLEIEDEEEFDEYRNEFDEGESDWEDDGGHVLYED